MSELYKYKSIDTRQTIMFVFSSHAETICIQSNSIFCILLFWDQSRCDGQNQIIWWPTATLCGCHKLWSHEWKGCQNWHSGKSKCCEMPNGTFKKIWNFPNRTNFSDDNQCAIFEWCSNFKCFNTFTGVPPNSRLIGSQKTRELGNPGIKRRNTSSKLFQPKVAIK